LVPLGNVPECLNYPSRQWLGAFPEEETMVGMAISVLWLLLGVVVLCAVIWFALYVIQQILGIAIPERVVQAIWLVVLILVVIGILTIVAGGSIGGMSMHSLR
jgi:multisubunit Na+/H+ antiporter MnhB subunit